MSMEGLSEATKVLWNLSEQGLSAIRKEFLRRWPFNATHCCVVTLYRTSHRRHSIVSVFLFLLASLEEARAGRAGEERQLDTREGA